MKTYTVINRLTGIVINFKASDYYSAERALWRLKEIYGDALRFATKEEEEAYT